MVFAVGKDNLFGFLRSGGLPEPEFSLMALTLIPMAAMGYLGLRLLGVRFGKPKPQSDEPHPRPLRQPQTPEEPPETNDD